MKERKIPRRSCIGCREEKDKKDLIRIVHTPEGEFHADPGGKAAGRGAYICRNPECLEKAFRSESLSRAFRIHVSKEVKETLRAEVEALVGE
ncbi:MAG: YlxR family protein [Lachnospiraceae bacterium]|nr:YlxR family protein [Lachnospiraceae bacterium]MBQ6195913.1 YlxR family protein [Lachnospiraceae bacterium]